MERDGEVTVKPVNKIKYLRSINVIEKSGVPIVSRYYHDDLIEQEHDQDLLAGFFAAINMFSQSTLKQEVKDIRMGNSKYYISNQGEYIYVIEVAFPHDLSDSQKRMINEQINQLMFNIQDVFSLYETFVESLEDGMSSIENEIDTMVFESELVINQDLATEFIEHLESDAILQPTRGKDRKVTKKTIWQKLGSFLKKDKES